MDRYYSNTSRLSGGLFGDTHLGHNMAGSRRHHHVRLHVEDYIATADGKIPASEELVAGTSALVD